MFIVHTYNLSRAKQRTKTKMAYRALCIVHVCVCMCVFVRSFVRRFGVANSIWIWNQLLMI